MMDGGVSIEWTDGHNHLQDDRFAGRQDELMAAATAAGVVGMVVNGTGEHDGSRVAELARRFPWVTPAFGCHPWHLRERTPGWMSRLESWLDQTPGSVVGEIGLDRWMIRNPDRWREHAGAGAADPPGIGEQEEAFLRQLHMAANRNVSVSIHCLDAFGRLGELLESNPRPARGFLLHSYGGPVELVPHFARLGGYFSFPGWFIQERKERQRETFRRIPPDRLLIETDAPDQRPPDAWNRHPLHDPRTGFPVNHPANLASIGEFLAGFLGVSPAALAEQTTANYRRLFGGGTSPLQAATSGDSISPDVAPTASHRPADGIKDGAS